MEFLLLSTKWTQKKVRKSMISLIGYYLLMKLLTNESILKRNYNRLFSNRFLYEMSHLYLILFL